MRRKTGVVATVLCLLGVGLILYVNRQYTPQPVAETQDRVPRLKQIVAEQEEESGRAFSAYSPTTGDRIDDLAIPVADLLRRLPGVVDVEVAVRADKPAARIVHLRDWHFVPRDLFAIDMKNALSREPTAEESDRLYQEMLLEVEAVQLEQIALLRCLTRHHGLKRIFSEGLTEEGLSNYQAQVGVQGQMEREQVPGLRKQLADVKELLRGMEAQGRTGSDRYNQAQQIERQFVGMIDDHKVRLLEVGSPGRLLISGEIEEVLPLDDADLLERAKPVTPAGKIRLDPAMLKARQDAIVKAVLARGSFGLIVLGGAHDLSDSVRRLGGGRCEYLRVTTRRFKEFSE